LLIKELIKKDKKEILTFSKKILEFNQQILKEKFFKKRRWGKC